MPSVISERAPKHWALPATHLECKLHQLSPYIGKLKSSIARDLIAAYTNPGDLVLDPFCGSGTIPLECTLMGRRPLAFDANPYAVMLTSAKLHPPKSVELALARLEEQLSRSLDRRIDLRAVPKWVRVFFHPRTLRDTLAFADSCLLTRDDFLLSCLMGILHHQRPGFLSFPSSHLVPYLRDRKYPRKRFPELYEARELESRIAAKVTRAFRTSFTQVTDGEVRHSAIEQLRLDGPVDSIITSPPYMNALDYVRDNRLRMWFLDRSTSDYSPEPTDNLGQFVRFIDSLVSRGIERLRAGGTCILIVGETVYRKRLTSHPAEVIIDRFSTVAPYLRLKRIIKDVIPDVRRTRHEGRATKQELVLVYERKSPRTRARTSDARPQTGAGSPRHI
jgi:hypothetical protein